MRYAITIDKMDSATGWTVLGNDTTNLATSTVCHVNSASLEFDKANGAANTVFAGAYKTINRSIDANSITVDDEIGMHVYVSAVTNVDYAFIRLGTDASNYVEYRFADSDLVAGAWKWVSSPLGTAYITGNGWSEEYVRNTGRVMDLDYMAVGLAFDAETNTLADIRVQNAAIVINTESDAF
jgi:hypothetical protein